MSQLDPSTFASMTPGEFAKLVKGMSDNEIREVMSGPLRGAVIEAITARMPQLFRPEKAKDTDVRVNWRITGGPDGGSDTFAVVIKDGTCTVEHDPAEEPTTSIMVGPAEFARLVTGAGNPVMMVMKGKVKVRGDVSTAMAFQNWFETPKA